MKNKHSLLDTTESDAWDEMSEWWAKVPCPVCGQSLHAVPMMNPDFSPIGENNPILEYVCFNQECHGWWDEYCERWNAFGTSCSVCMVRNMRSETNYQEFDNRGVELFRKQVRGLELN